MQEGWVKEESGRLLAAGAAREVKVYFRPCTNPACSKQLLYTGEQVGVFNHSHKYLMCYELGILFWKQFAAQRLTFAAHHEEMASAYELTGCAELLPSRNTHRWVMISDICLRLPIILLHLC